MHTVRSFTTKALARCRQGWDAAADSSGSDDIPEGLVVFAAARGSLGPVADALEVWGLLGRLSERDRADMKVTLARSELFNRAQSRAVSEFLSLSADSGVPVVLFKGHDLLNRYYNGDTLRPTTDADILVRERDTRKVERLLLASGFSSPERRGSNWTRGALAIDVHTGFTDTRRMSSKRHLPHIPTEHIFERAETHMLHGAPYLSPDPYHTLTLTALHALTHSYLMDFWFLDIAVVIAFMGEDFSYDTLLAQSDRYGLSFSIGQMLWALGNLFSYPLPEGLEGAVQPGPLIRRLIRTATERTEYLFFGEAMLGLHVDTYKKKFYYFRELLFPGSEVVARELGVPDKGPIRLFFRRAAYLLSSLVRLMLPKRRNTETAETNGKDRSTPESHPGWIIRRKSPVAVASFPEGEVVLFALADRRPFLINITAREVLELTDGARTLEDVAFTLSSRYDIDNPDGRAAVRGDVDRIWRELLFLGVCEHVQ